MAPHTPWPNRDLTDPKIRNLTYFNMEFAINRFAFIIHKFERMRTESVHVPEPIRRTAIAEQEHNLMNRFRSQRQKIPKHIRILQKKTFIVRVSHRTHRWGPLGYQVGDPWGTKSGTHCSSP